VAKNGMSRAHWSSLF